MNFTIKKLFFSLFLIVVVSQISYSQLAGQFSETTIVIDTASERKIVHKKFIVKTGFGVSSSGSNQLNLYTYENEFEYRFSDYFSTTLHIDFSTKQTLTTSLIQGALNINCFPFGNFKKHNFGFGFGINGTYLSKLGPGEPIVFSNHKKEQYIKIDDTYMAVGVILKYVFKLSDKVDIGLNFNNLIEVYPDRKNFKLLMNLGYKL